MVTNNDKGEKMTTTTDWKPVPAEVTARIDEGLQRLKKIVGEIQAREAGFADDHVATVIGLDSRRNREGGRGGSHGAG